jgi:hypothetical protein
MSPLRSPLRRPWLKVVAAAALVGALLASIDTVVTYATRGYLKRHGVECDRRFWVDVSWSLASAQLSPFSCDITNGPVAHLDVFGSTTGNISGGRVASIVATHVRIDRRVLPSSRPEPTIPSWTH